MSIFASGAMEGEGESETTNAEEKCVVHLASAAFAAACSYFGD